MKLLGGKSNVTFHQQGLCVSWLAYVIVVFFLFVLSDMRLNSFSFSGVIQPYFEVSRNIISSVRKCQYIKVTKRTGLKA